MERGGAGQVLTPAGHLRQSNTKRVRAMDAQTRSLCNTALRDENSRQRRRAGERLVAMGEGAVAPLVEALHDADSVVRRRAASLLWHLGDRHAPDPLIAALQDDDAEVRIAAVRGLEKLGQERALAPIVAALAGCQDPTLRSAVASAMARIGAPAVDALLDLLSHSDAVVRAAAADALGKIGVPQAVEPLIAALNDADPGVRAAAAYALWPYKDARAVQPLIAILEGDTSAWEETAYDTLAAADALTWMGDVAVDALIVALRAPDVTTRRLAAAALGDMGASRAIPALARAQNDPDEDVSWAAEHALQEIARG